MKKCLLIVSFLLLPFFAVAGDCQEQERAGKLDCASEFRKYYEYLESNSQVVEKIDEAKLSSLSERVILNNDKTMKCVSISKDEEEYDLLADVLVKEGSLLSSIRAYLKFNSKYAYVGKKIKEYLEADYKQLVGAVFALNKFVSEHQQYGQAEGNVDEPSCGPR